MKEREEEGDEVLSELGLSQKEQEEIIKKFKKGTFNVLVATCIGEEGLGIFFTIPAIIIIFPLISRLHPFKFFNKF
jgi:ERCC4-related helicase